MSHRILVVDDEESIRSLLKEYFEERGFLVAEASDADQAERVFESRRCHLAVIDFLLPRRNGFAVAETIRKNATRNDTPLILVSGVFKNPKTAVEAREKYGVVDFLSKPLDLERLHGLITEALRDVPPDAEQDEPPPLVSLSMDVSMPAAAAAKEAVQKASSGLPPRGLSYGKGGSPRSERPPMVAPSVRAAQDARSSAPRGAAPREATAVPSSSPSPSEPSLPPTPAGRAEGGRWVGPPFPPIREEGSVETYPLAMLLSALAYQKATGMLDLNHEATHRRLYMIEGRPTFMQSNYEGENVGALLLRRGRVTEPDFERCLKYMKEENRTLQQALLDLKLVVESDLATAYKLLAGQLLPSALGMATGKYRWRESDAFVGRVPEGNFDPMTLLFDGIKRFVHPPQIFAFFRGREDYPLLPSELFDPLLPYFRKAFSADHVAGQVDGHATYRRISKSQDAAQVVPQLFALACSGMVVLPEPNASMDIVAAVEAAAFSVGQVDEVAGPNQTGAEVSGERDRLFASIDRAHRQVMSKNFFEIFQVDRSATVEDIKARYFELARRWQPDSFRDQDLGDRAARLEQLFERITEAYNTLTDKVRREEYIMYLDRKAKGLPTDVGQLSKAEQLYDQAAAMMNRKEWAKACEVLNEAIRKNPDPAYFATLGWATFNTAPNQPQAVARAVQYLKKSLKLQEDLPIAHQIMGQLCYARGQLPEARKWWKKCLEREPNNPEAQRGLRLLAQKMGQDASGDDGSKNHLLNRFMSKK